jgi:hypothetical protein
VSFRFRFVSAGLFMGYLDSIFRGCEAAGQIGGGAKFGWVRFGQCIRIHSILEMDGLQDLAKKLPRK